MRGAKTATYKVLNVLNYFLITPFKGNEMVTTFGVYKYLTKQTKDMETKI